ncbi:MAG: hypothetical protein O3C34_04875 [Proteobacteria bacterium]|nr:hypothetical protein [Pseudomonadota bacterium]
MFDDDAFVLSINIAKLNVFAACLSDLTIHAIAVATHDRPVTNDTRNALALDCYAAAIKENATDATDEFSPQTCNDAFRQRLDDTDWEHGARQRENFTRSPRELVKWAPIAPELKRLDQEVVENSMKFAWRDIRLQLQKRLDAVSINGELMRRDET